MNPLQERDVPYGDDWDSATNVAAWAEAAVVSMQAVNELRHKRNAPRLYEQIHHILTVPGLVMICDHTPFDESAASRALYMTEQEQRKALADARLGSVGIDLSVNGLVLYVGERAD